MASKQASAKALRLKIVYEPIAKVKKYPRNIVSHPEEQVDEIAASMDQFGNVVPALVDKNGTLIAGEGRLMAAEKRGDTEVPVIYLHHLTADQARALRIVENASSRKREWLPDVLRAEMQALEEAKFDLAPFDIESIPLPVLETPTIEDEPPRRQRNKTTIFLSVENAQAAKAKKVVITALNKAKISHNL